MKNPKKQQAMKNAVQAEIPQHHMTIKTTPYYDRHCAPKHITWDAGTFVLVVTQIWQRNYPTFAVLLIP